MIGKLASSLLSVVLTSTALAGICQAEESCKPLNRDASISRVLNDHAGSKVLKVDERQGDNGCAYLEIGILIDGTVKAVVVKGQKSA